MRPPASGAPFGLLAVQRALLSPLAAPGKREAAGLDTVVQAIGADAFIGAIVRHGLGPLWFDHLAAHKVDALDEAPLDTLKHERIAHLAAATQKTALTRKVQSALTGANVPSVVFKGLHLAHAIYPDPGLRPSADVDIIVPVFRRDAALRVLKSLGARFAPRADAIGTQVACRMSDVEFDLHWRFVRPGRSASEIAETLLQAPRALQELQVPNETATLLTLLTHPVLSTRPGADDAKLIRLVDLVLWQRAHGKDIAPVIPALERTGTAYAAWFMFEWLRRLTGTPASNPLPAHLSPGPRRQRLLARWLPGDATDIPWRGGLAVQLGFRPLLQPSARAAAGELACAAGTLLRARSQLAAFQALLREG